MLYRESVDETCDQNSFLVDLMFTLMPVIVIIIIIHLPSVLFWHQVNYSGPWTLKIMGWGALGD